MPDSTTQKMMDRGWADMHRQLDERDGNRPPGRHLRWLALTLLLVIGGCGGWYAWQQRTEAPAAVRDVVQTPTAPATTRVAENPKRDVGTVAETPAPTAPDVRARTATPSPQSPPLAPVTDLPRTTAPARPDRVLTGAPRSRTLTVPPSIDPPVPAAYEHAGARIVLHAPPPAPPAGAFGGLTTLPMLPQRVVGQKALLSIAAPPPSSERGPNPVVFAAQVGSYATPAYPLAGAYAQADATHPLGGRWQVRTGLALDARSFRSYVGYQRPTAAESADLATGQSGPVSSDQSSPQLLTNQTQTADLSSLSATETYAFAGRENGGTTYAARTTHTVYGVSVPVSLEYRLAQRWQVFGGGSLRYNLSRPLSSPLPTTYTTNEAVRFERSNPTVLRTWNVRAHAGASFQLGRRTFLQTALHYDVSSRFADFLQPSSTPVELRLGIGRHFGG